MPQIVGFLALGEPNTEEFTTRLQTTSSPLVAITSTPGIVLDNAPATAKVEGKTDVSITANVPSQDMHTQAIKHTIVIEFLLALCDQLWCCFTVA